MFSKIERGDRRAKREQVIKLSECFLMRMNCLLLSNEVKKKGMRLFLTHPRVYCCEPVIAASACASFSGEPMSNQRRRNRIHYYVVPFKKLKNVKKLGCNWYICQSCAIFALIY